MRSRLPGVSRVFTGEPLRPQRSLVIAPGPDVPVMLEGGGAISEAKELPPVLPKEPVSAAAAESKYSRPSSREKQAALAANRGSTGTGDLSMNECFR